jgi:hypothetical protein
MEDSIVFFYEMFRNKELHLRNVNVYVCDRKYIKQHT